MIDENRLDDKNKLPVSLDGPRGIGGWLALLIVILTILSPLVKIVMLAKEFSEIEMGNPLMLLMAPYVQYKWFCWGMAWIISALSIGVGCLLWKKHEWKTVRMTICFFWVLEPLAITLLGFYLYMSFGSEVLTELLRDLPRTLVKFIVWSGIWTAYLLKSKRVRNTYVRENP